MGYVVIKNSTDDQVRGIWHDGPNCEKTSISKNNGETVSRSTSFLSLHLQKCSFLFFIKHLWALEIYQVQIKASFDGREVIESIANGNQF